MNTAYTAYIVYINTTAVIYVNRFIIHVHFGLKNAAICKQEKKIFIEHWTTNLYLDIIWQHKNIIQLIIDIIIYMHVDKKSPIDQRRPLASIFCRHDGGWGVGVKR